MARFSWTVQDIITATGGELCFGDMSDRFAGIAIDSRRIGPSELFVAIRGEIHDGHTFAESAVEKGVKGVLINRHRISGTLRGKWQKTGVLCIAVENPNRALGHLANFNRHRAGVSVVAITGSNGKTTTREMAAGVVSRRFNTLAARGNFNNDIGLPLTLLSLKPEHECAIVELGMNRPGEISRLGEICSPEIGVITNIGPAHLEGVGTLDGVMEAKAELLEKVQPGGTVILNADDERVRGLAERTENRVVYFGLSERADVKGEDVKDRNGSLVFKIRFPDTSVKVHLPTPGEFMVSNALAAAAIGHRLGLTTEDIKAGLEGFNPVQGRMNVFSPGKGIHVIDDTYNANPESMAAAIKTHRTLRGNHRGLMVIGDMFELGEHSSSLHRKIGRLAADSGITQLYTAGEFADSVAAGAKEGMMDPGSITAGDKADILRALTDQLLPGDWVLVKGSRGMRMETIVEGIKTWTQNQQ